MRVTIKTPQRSFITDPDRWMGSSTYFTSLFSGRWGDGREDGAYLIETEDVIFEHILRYLRTGVLPLFYDMEKGHDYPLYHALLSEANYFGIDRLRKWLCSKTYQKAVKVHYVLGETIDPRVCLYISSDIADRDGSFFLRQTYIRTEVTAESQVQITVTPHADAAVVSEDDKRPYIKWSVVHKETVFDHELCVTAHLEDENDDDDDDDG